MYSLPKGPTTNKVLVKSRRSIPPRMDAFENRGNMKNRRENYPINDLNSTRHVYHNSSSGKKTYHHHHYPRESRVISPQHQEMISYIHGNWEGVMRQYESDAQLHSSIPLSGKRLPRVAYYKHNENFSRHSPSKNSSVCQKYNNVNNDLHCLSPRDGEIGNRDMLGTKDLPPKHSSSTHHPTMNLPK